MTMEEDMRLVQEGVLSRLGLMAFEHRRTQPVDFLLRLLKAGSWRQRVEAIRALDFQQQQGTHAVPMLPIVPLCRDAFPYVRAAALDLLGRYQDQGLRPLFVQGCADPHWMVRYAGVRGLSRQEDVQAENVCHLLGDIDATVRTGAVMTLQRVGLVHEVLVALLWMLHDEEVRVRLAAIEALTGIVRDEYAAGHAAVISAFTDLLDDEQEPIRQMVHQIFRDHEYYREE